MLFPNYACTQNTPVFPIHPQHLPNLPSLNYDGHHNPTLPYRYTSWAGDQCPWWLSSDPCLPTILRMCRKIRVMSMYSSRLARM